MLGRSQAKMADDCIKHVTTWAQEQFANRLYTQFAHNRWSPVRISVMTRQCPLALVTFWSSSTHGKIPNVWSSEVKPGLGSAVGFWGDLTDKAVERGHIPGPTVLICLLRFIQHCHDKCASLHLELRHVSPSVSCLPPSRLPSICLRAWDSRRQSETAGDRERQQETERDSFSVVNHIQHKHSLGLTRELIRFLWVEGHWELTEEYLWP